MAFRIMTFKNWPHPSLGSRVIKKKKELTLSGLLLLPHILLLGFSSRLERNKKEGMWQGYHESRKCSRDTHPESYITRYTRIRNAKVMLK